MRKASPESELIRFSRRMTGWGRNGGFWQHGMVVTSSNDEPFPSSVKTNEFHYVEIRPQVTDGDSYCCYMKMPYEDIPALIKNLQGIYDKVKSLTKMRYSYWRLGGGPLLAAREWLKLRSAVVVRHVKFAAHFGGKPVLNEDKMVGISGLPGDFVPLGWRDRSGCPDQRVCEPDTRTGYGRSLAKEMREPVPDNAALGRVMGVKNLGVGEDELTVRLIELPDSTLVLEVPLGLPQLLPREVRIRDSQEMVEKTSEQLTQIDGGSYVPGRFRF